MSVTELLAVIAAVAGCEGLWKLVERITEKHSKTVRREQLEKLSAQISENTNRLCTLSDDLREHELVTLRQLLFQRAKSRGEQEHQLEIGKRYIKLGGNGAGHLRLDELQADYARRLRDDDWIY